MAPDLMLATSGGGGTLGLETGPVSRRYREKTEGPVITNTWEAAGKSAVVTLLYPFQGAVPSSRLTDVTPGDSRGRSSSALLEHDGFTDLVYARGDSARIVAPLVETDAEYLFLRRERGGSMTRFAAFGCSSLNVGGVVLYRTGGTEADVTFDGKTLVVDGAYILRCEARVPVNTVVRMNNRPVKTRREGGMLVVDR
jgi:hypothetical protein